MPSEKSIMGPSVMLSATVSKEMAENARRFGVTSDHIRNSVREWIAAGAPSMQFELPKFRVQIGAYFTEYEYYALMNVCLPRHISMSDGIRCALAYMEEHHAAN